MRASPWIPLIALALGVAVLGGLRPDRAGRPDRSDPGPAPAPDRRAFDFVDDEGEGRVLSTLDLVLEPGDGGGGRLVVTTSAVGPRVDAVPGFRGVHGANHVTAHEQRDLLAAGLLELATDVVTEHGDEAARPGTVRAGRVGRLPERRLRADGTIDHFAETEQVYPLELVFDSGPLPRGHHVARVVVAGHERLSAEVRIGDTLEILRVESVAHVEEYELPQE